MRHAHRLLTVLLLPVLLAGCDLFGGGGESAEALAARKEAEGKAVGGACRHAGRAIEDCYVLNKRADKAAVFAGWREMNDYMRDNKVEAVAPQVSPAAAETAAKAEAAEPAPKTRTGKAKKAES
jgi:outer membrane PBP1 activator LpoA protein